MLIRSTTRNHHLVTRCLVVPPQCRGISLMHPIASRGKQPPSLKLTHFQRVPDFKHEKFHESGVRREGDDIQLELWSLSPRRKIGVMDLFTARQEHIRPGVVLAPFATKADRIVSKPSALQTRTGTGKSLQGNEKATSDSGRSLKATIASQRPQPPRYYLVDISKSPRPKRIAGHRGRGAKLLFMSTYTDRDGFVHLVKKAWHFNRNGNNVEFHVLAANQKTGKTISGGKEARKTGVGFRGDVQLDHQFDWKTAASLAKLDLRPAEMLHLRPDLIASALPQGSSFVIAPMADFHEYAWVLAPPGPTKVKEKSEQVIHHAADYAVRIKQMRLDADVLRDLEEMEADRPRVWRRLLVKERDEPDARGLTISSPHTSPAREPVAQGLTASQHTSAVRAPDIHDPTTTSPTSVPASTDSLAFRPRTGLTGRSRQQASR